MTIDQVIKLWQQGKYKYLILKPLPVINHEGKITHGSAIYRKGETINFGGEYKVEEHLQHLYKDNIYILDDVDEDCISFKTILEKEVR